MAPPRSGLRPPPPQGGTASGLAKPDPRRLLGFTRRTSLALLLGIWGLSVRAQALDLKTLMQRMAQRKAGEARFTEERIVSGIDSPLTASGTLSFSAPDRFARHTLHPLKESMEVQGRTLLLRRGGRTRQLEMDTVPEVGALLEALRGTLTGDAALLRKHFRTELTGSDAQWVLLLEPLDERLARQVMQIEVVGQATDVRSIALQLTGGDRSLMLLEPVTPPGASGPAGR